MNSPTMLSCTLSNLGSMDHDPNQAHNRCPNLVHKTNHVARPTSKASGGQNSTKRGCSILLGEEVIFII